MGWGWGERRERDFFSVHQIKCAFYGLVPLQVTEHVRSIFKNMGQRI